jgi:flavin-dependent dehydrogenase
LILAVNGISRQELHDYWNTFTHKISFNPQATGYFELEFQTGSVIKHQVDNTLLVGNAGGFGDMQFGQGVMMSALSGVEAARAIVQQDNYEQRIRYLVQTKGKLNDWQQRLNHLDNRGLDLLLRIVKIPGIRNSSRLIRLMSGVAAGWGNNKENL